LGGGRRAVVSFKDLKLVRRVRLIRRTVTASCLDVV
jgi:hypothetical protein